MLNWRFPCRSVSELVLILFGVSTISPAALDNSKQTDYETSTTGFEDHFQPIPSSWYGEWYQYNEHTGGTTMATINQTHICTSGTCDRIYLSGHSGSYKMEKEFEVLLSSKDRLGDACWFCMLGFERHHNILQYRISQRCVSSAQEACHVMDINRPMKIMFRGDAAVESCPVSGPANFSYSTVTDDRCDTLKSTMAGCIDDSRLRLEYIACPGMRMDSRIDDIRCIGRFEAFSRKYFLGKVTNKPSFGSEGDLHRCFMYETTSSGGTLMMSEDASCQSLDMDQASVKIHYISTDSTPKPSCSFHHWLRYRKHNKDEEIVWESLSSSNDAKHVFDRHKWTIENGRDGEKSVRAGMTRKKAVNLCVHYVTDHKEENAVATSDGTKVERLVVYSIDECERGYRCVEFYHHPKRTRNQVMDVLIGHFAPTSFEACNTEYFDKDSLHFETLLDSASKEQECPTEHRGQYRMRGCEENDAALFFGCGNSLSHALIFYEDCAQANPNLYHCYGDWIDPDNPHVHYLAVKEMASGKKTCFAYERTAEDNELALSTFRQHSCKRGILTGINDRRTYNLTKTGQCDKIPWRVANLTMSDAYAKYDESSLSARSVDNPSRGSIVRRLSKEWIFFSFLLLLLLRNA